jgi:hypothetical protein
MGIPNLGQLGPVEFAGGDGIRPPAIGFVEGDAACAVFGVSTKGVRGVPVPLAGLVRLVGDLSLGVLDTMQPVFDCFDVGELGDTGQLGIGSAIGFLPHASGEHDESETIGLDVEVRTDDPLHATTFVVAVVGDFVEDTAIVEGGDDLIGCEVLEHDSDPFCGTIARSIRSPQPRQVRGSGGMDARVQRGHMSALHGPCQQHPWEEAQRIAQMLWYQTGAPKPRGLRAIPLVPRVVRGFGVLWERRSVEVLHNPSEGGGLYRELLTVLACLSVLLGLEAEADSLSGGWGWEEGDVTQGGWVHVLEGEVVFHGSDPF